MGILLDFFSHISVSTFRGEKVVNMVVTRASHSCSLIELCPICNSMAASLLFKSFEDHRLLKSYNGGLWKNNYRSGFRTKKLLVRSKSVESYLIIY